ncbi:MAG: carboxymuconolactone decarboxylase family protein, partial [Burkholderiaceae bacterium]|nr:carboxymuconolactone decarboxylase family protein [Burkholderiaceae bacterium]
MQLLNTIKDEIPDWAKDIRLNLHSLLALPGKLSREDALATALASAFAAKSPFLIEQFK